MCDRGDTVDVEVTIVASHSHTGEDRREPKPIDRCLAPFVRSLDAAGVRMTGSCCGHGHGHPSILLEDGSELTIFGGRWMLSVPGKWLHPADAGHRFDRALVSVPERIRSAIERLENDMIEVPERVWITRMPNGGLKPDDIWSRSERSGAAEYVPASELARVAEERDEAIAALHDVMSERDTARARVAELERELRALEWLVKEDDYRLTRMNGLPLIVYDEDGGEDERHDSYVSAALALGWEDGHG